MTKEITKAHILQEMQDKLGLRELEPATFEFLETVIPIYNIEQHLQKWTTELETVSITSASGFSFFVVPETEKWHLRLYDVVFMAVGAYTLAGTYIVRKTGGSIYLDLAVAKSTSYHVDLVEPVVLNPGDSLRINVDGYTSTADLRLYIDYLKETVR